MRNTLALALAISLVTAHPFPAQDLSRISPQFRYDEPGKLTPPTSRGTWWKISAMLTAAAAAADAHSSWGRMELNPVLRSSNGRFGLQGIAIKSLVTGGSIGAQYILLRRNPKAEKYGVAINMLMAGIMGTAATTNRIREARAEKEAASVSLPVR